MEQLFNVYVDSSLLRNLHQGGEFVEECSKNPRCFTIYIDNPSYDRRKYHFFKNHYLMEQMEKSFIPTVYTLYKHSLTLDTLKIIKYFQFGTCCTVTGLDSKSVENKLEYYQQNREKFVIGTPEWEIPILKDYNERLKQENKNLKAERKAFEQEKQELEKELAKYKGIVMNCQREIQAYRL